MREAHFAVVVVAVVILLEPGLQMVVAECPGLEAVRSHMVEAVSCKTAGSLTMEAAKECFLDSRDLELVTAAGYFRDSEPADFQAVTFAAVATPATL